MLLLDIYPEIPGLETELVRGVSGGLTIARNSGPKHLESICTDIAITCEGRLDELTPFFQGVLAAFGATIDIAYQN